MCIFLSSRSFRIFNTSSSHHSYDKIFCPPCLKPPSWVAWRIWNSGATYLPYSLCRGIMERMEGTLWNGFSLLCVHTCTPKYTSRRSWKLYNNLRKVPATWKPLEWKHSCTTHTLQTSHLPNPASFIMFSFLPGPLGKPWYNPSSTYSNMNLGFKEQGGVFYSRALSLQGGSVVCNCPLATEGTFPGWSSVSIVCHIFYPNIKTFL